MTSMDAVITKEGEFYIASFPQFGLTSSGKTVNEALAKLHEEAKEMFEQLGITDCYIAG